MSNFTSKVTEAQRLEILRVYAGADGFKKAAALCVEMGLSPKYCAALAHSRGVSRKKSRPLTAEQKQEMRRIVPADDSHDPRWQWAIERGPVIA